MEIEIEIQSLDVVGRDSRWEKVLEGRVATKWPEGDVGLYIIKALSIIILFIMKNTKFKDKAVHSGHSEFIRQKLDQVYNPKVRFQKHQLMSLSVLNDDHRHESKAREEMQVSEKALAKLKEGKRLVIDWNTKSNFRSTKPNFTSSIFPSSLPKINTEPSYFHSLKSTSTISKAIHDKKLHLQKLLYTQHHKNYLITKKEKQDYRRLFGEELNMKSQKGGSTMVRPKMDVMMTMSINRSGIEEVQSSILDRSRLVILKQDLKLKFKEIKGGMGVGRKRLRIQTQI